MMTCWWKEKMASWRWKILVTLIDQERSIWWQQNIRLDTCKANKKKSRPLKIVGYLMESALVHVVKFLCHTTHKPDRSVTTSPSTVTKKSDEKSLRGPVFGWQAGRTRVCDRAGARDSTGGATKPRAPPPPTLLHYNTFATSNTTARLLRWKCGAFDVSTTHAHFWQHFCTATAAPHFCQQ